MQTRSLNYYSNLFIVLAGIFLILALIGGVHHYSPVPLWDMWDSYLVFYDQVNKGNYAFWWLPANEHRILLTRLFFWLDLRFFQGNLIFLYFINYFLTILSVSAFFYFVKKGLPEKENQKLCLIIISLISVLLFSLIQKENFYWANQSQFFLAQLLPLVSFLLLYSVNTSKKYSFYLYLFSIILGFASSGTMANGILVLPMLTIMAVCLRMRWSKIVGLSVFSLLVLYLYLHGYQSNDHLITALTKHFIDYCNYMVVYLGGPFFYMFGLKSFIYAKIAGIFFIGSFIFFTYKVLFKNPEKKELQLALLFFILYIIVTAFLTAGGRLIGGSLGAISSRYMTAALMGWSAVLILHAIYFKDKLIKSHYLLILLLFIPALLLPMQLSALNNHRAANFEQLVAALAIEMGIHDKNQVTLVYPQVNHVLAFSKPSIEKNLSIFGNPLIKDTRNIIGKPLSGKSSVPCVGNIEVIEKIPGEPHYNRITGWFYDPKAKRSPTSLFIVNQQNKIIGYAITGLPRPDLARSINKKIKNSGFQGYIIANSARGSLFLEGNNPNCSFFLH